ncbi:MAG: rRNA maturation RNase YbeY [Dehalococcoidia bacterium]|nr:rRNA maturation RNase YbeY [Dehalococcoidia bacterium]
MPRKVPIQVLPGCGGRISVPELRRIARHVLDAEGVASNVEVEIVLADSDTVRKLSRLYRGKDEATDVLSFATDTYSDWPDPSPDSVGATLAVAQDAPSTGDASTLGPPSPISERGLGGEVEAPTFIDAPDATPSLGEIVICIPYAETTVAENPATRTVRGQIAHLLTHGLLHLLGYDHEASEREAQRMQQREDALLAVLGYEGAYEHGH